VQARWDEHYRYSSDSVPRRVAAHTQGGVTRSTASNQGGQLKVKNSSRSL
jgi:hypothetical protein